MQLLLLSLLQYSEMLSQTQSFQLSFELLFYLQIKLEGNLLDQNVGELENELVFRIQLKSDNLRAENCQNKHKFLL